MADLLDAVRGWIDAQRLLSHNNRVLVAVSGGVDSMVLAHVLLQLQEDYGLQLQIAHLNHLLRDQAHADADFVAHQANKWQLKHHSGTTDVAALAKSEKLSLEDAARRARYAFLDAIAESENVDKVALGHHLNDQVETLLLNLVRGAGPPGLAAMPARRGRYVRPLLNCRRSDIERYAAENAIAFVEDLSNLDQRFLRNKVRHTLLPQLEALNPNVLETLHRTQTHMRQLVDFAMEKSNEALQTVLISSNEQEIVLDRNAMRQLHPAIQTGIVRQVFGNLSGNAKGLDTRHFQRALAMSASDGHGQLLEFPKGRRIFVEADQLRFFVDTAADPEYAEVYLNLDGTTHWRHWSFISRQAPAHQFDMEQTRSHNRLSVCVDLSRIQPPLKVRSRSPGDRIDPLGMDGHKKVQDVLIDAKVPRPKRDQVPIVVDNAGLIWVVGHCLSDRAKVSPSTQNILCLTACTAL